MAWSRRAAECGRAWEVSVILREALCVWMHEQREGQSSSQSDTFALASPRNHGPSHAALCVASTGSSGLDGILFPGLFIVHTACCA